MFARFDVGFANKYAYTASAGAKFCDSGSALASSLRKTITIDEEFLVDCQWVNNNLFM